MTVALLTGIGGQTGSYLCEELIASGWDVHGISNSSTAVSSSHAETIHYLDIREEIELHNLVMDLAPDAVVNLAAISSVAQSWKEPVLTVSTNVLPVSTILNSLSILQKDKSQQIRFIQASSSEIFGKGAELPITESSPINPSNPYGASKAAAHLLTTSYRTNGLNASNAILFNHESPRRPENFVTRKISLSVAKISLGLQEKLVLGDSSIKRDWGWAPDYAHAIKMMIDSAHAEDYVIATGKSHSIENFVEKAFGVVGIHNWEDYVEFDSSLFRNSDADDVIGSSEKIQSELGWKPSITFSQIVEEMVKSDLIFCESAARTS